MKRPQQIRVGLNEDGTVVYIPWFRSTEEDADDDDGEYGDTPMDPREALTFLRAGVPAEFACDAPEDPEWSHYETLGQTVTFHKI